MPNPAAAISLSEDQKQELAVLVRNGNTPQKVALRCRLLLLASEGIANQFHRSATEPVSAYNPGFAQRLCQGWDSGGHRYSEAGD